MTDIRNCDGKVFTRTRTERSPEGYSVFEAEDEKVRVRNDKTLTEFTLQANPEYQRTPAQKLP